MTIFVNLSDLIGFGIFTLLMLGIALIFGIGHLQNAWRNYQAAKDQGKMT